MRSIQNVLISGFLVFGLAGCGGGSDSPGYIPPDFFDKTPVWKLSGNDQVVDAYKDELYDIEIFGNLNTVTVKAGSEVRDFDLTGNSNVIILEDTISIDFIGIFGSDNTFYYPDGYTISFDENTGTGNTAIAY